MWSLLAVVVCVASIVKYHDYRILYNGKAVSLVTGKKVHKIEPRDVVHDLHAYGAPIALQDREDNPAQFWIFHDLTGVDAFNTIINNSRLPAGTYKVVNSETGTVLGIRETVNKPGTHTVDCRYDSPTAADLFLFIISSGPVIK